MLLDDLGRVAHHEQQQFDDSELLRRIGAADRDAFGQLYLRYHQRLSRFVTCVTSRDRDAEDVVNDAFLIVWLSAGDYRDELRVSTWLFRIACRCTLEADLTQAAQVRQMIQLGLERLPIEQRIVLALAYCMDCSCEEIAAIVECPVDTVKLRMFHARRRLRVFLSRSG